MAFPLLLLLVGVGVEVGAQGFGDQCGQRQPGIDGVVLDLPDQPDRQVNVELLDVLVAHIPDASILASYVASQIRGV